MFEPTELIKPRNLVLQYLYQVREVTTAHIFMC